MNKLAFGIKRMQLQILINSLWHVGNECN